MDDDATDEVELVRRFREGDEEALRVLLDRDADALRARAVRWIGVRLRRRLSAADLLQEARLTAYQRRGDFEHRGDGSFRNWLLAIVDLKAREALRRHVGVAKRAAARELSRGQRPESTQFQANGPTPSQGAARSEAAERARRALETLPEDYRAVLHLAREEGLMMREVAERMGRSREAVKKLYGRALVRFKEAFDAVGNGS